MYNPISSSEFFMDIKRKIVRDILRRDTAFVPEEEEDDDEEEMEEESTREEN